MTAVKDLHGLPGTLWYTLRARAEEQAQPQPLIQDPLAAAWYGQLPPPPAVAQAMSVTYSPVFQLATAVRARLYDDVTQDFLTRYPAAQVVELGAGLSTRFQRLGCPAVPWWELDLPPAIEVRRLVDKETAVHRFLAASMLAAEWVKPVQETAVPPAQTLFIAEGVLFFLLPDHVRQLFNILRTHFPGALLAADVLTDTYSPKARSQFIHTSTPLQWLITQAAELIDLGLALQQSRVITHQHMARWQALGFSQAKLRASSGNILFTARVQPG